MALEDILGALDEKANARVEAIKEEARQRANEIAAEVDRDVARLERLRLKKVEDALRSEATAIVYSASLKAKNQLIKAQEEAVDEAFRIAEQKLAEVSCEPRYPGILETLLLECLEFFPGADEVLLQVRADDRDIVERLMASGPMRYRVVDESLGASGGLIVSSSDGQVVVSNTFESRLVKARDHLRLQISSALFGDGS
ncbi:MAG: V-type ATP synthase subunit E [Actinomycetota bacterium]